MTKLKSITVNFGSNVDPKEELTLLVLSHEIIAKFLKQTHIVKGEKFHLWISKDYADVWEHGYRHLGRMFEIKRGD